MMNTKTFFTALSLFLLSAVALPVVAQTASLAIASDFPKEYGFTTGSSGTCFSSCRCG